METRKPWRCRLGFHLTYGDTTGRNIGSAEQPIYVMTTVHRCNDCDWSDQIYPPDGGES